ncbi:uncharacterized protein LOC132554684 [Ylistrum balloti]|uniref:uncharacterized protein LOC132554684 n=1 Tax=Ylistrum balloti TaxID=509963 RepID=UPI002905BA1C|nr:uncharacterized protein LOC132554684 [Ylistrum balloti]
MDWRYEIRCLMTDSEVTPGSLVQALRRSLRGVAHRVLVTMGDKATPREILARLDALFGDVSTHGMIMQEFFNSKQRSDESVTNFGCRLESLLQTAIDNGSLHKAAKNDLLRHKFWTSLHSDKLKSQTRHKYDVITSYEELLREIRTVEKEINLVSDTSSSVGTAPHQKDKKKGQSNVVTVEVDQQQVNTGRDLTKEFDKKLKMLEEKLVSQIDTKFDKILEKLDSHKPHCNQKSYKGQGQGQGQGQSPGQGRRKNNYKKSGQKSYQKKNPNE